MTVLPDVSLVPDDMSATSAVVFIEDRLRSTVGRSVIPRAEVQDMLLDILNILEPMEVLHDGQAGA